MTNSFVLLSGAQTPMPPMFFFLIVAGLVLLVLAFALYIFPYVVCPAFPEIEQADPRDPIKGFCSIFG